MKVLVYSILIQGLLSPAFGVLPTPTYVPTPDVYLGEMTDYNHELLTDGIVPASFTDAGIVDYYLPEADDTQEIVFDFGSTQTIGSVVIDYFTYSFYQSEAPELVEFYFSTDGVTYTSEPISYDQFNTNYISGDQTAGSQEYGLGSNSARYVKVVMTPGGAGNELFLSEITFSDTVVPVAEPDFTISVASYTATPAPAGAVDNNSDLTNGIMEPSDPYSTDWVGYRTVGATQQIVFDFGSAQRIGGIDLHFLIVEVWGIEAPESVEFLFSTDGAVFEDSFIYDEFDQTASGGHTVSLNCPDIEAQFVKLIITPGTRGDSSQSEMFIGEVSFIIPLPENEDPPPNIYTSDPVANYTALDETGNDLYDGILPTDLYDLNWVEYFSASFTYSFDFDFGEGLTLENVGLYYDAESIWGIEAPSEATFMFSSDGITYGNYILIKDFKTNDGMHKVAQAAQGIECSYAKVNVKTKAPSGIIRLGEILFTQKGAPVSYADISGYGTVFNDDGMDAVELTDGDTATPVEYFPGITGYSVPIVFDLNSPKGVSSIKIDYIAGAWGLDLNTVLVEFSDDGNSYGESYTLDNIDSTSAGFTDYSVTVGTPGAYGRYAKVTFTTVDTGLKLTEVTFTYAGQPSYTCSIEPANFSDPGNKLFDGAVAGDFYDDLSVTYDFEIDDANFVIAVDLAETKTIESIGLNYIAWDAWNMTIDEVIAEFSEDGVAFGSPYTATVFTNAYGANAAKVNTPGATGRFVRLSITPDSYVSLEKIMLSEVTFYEAGQASYILSEQPLYVDPDLTGRTLIDGVIPDSNAQDPGWIQYDTGHDVTVNITLGDLINLSDIGIAYLGHGVENGPGWTWELDAPGSATVYTSLDDETYTQVGHISNFTDSADEFTSLTQNFGLAAAQQARFVRVEINHDPSDDKPFMIGEIILQEAACANAPVIVCAGFASFTDPFTIIAVFDQDINTSDVVVGNFEIDGHRILGARLADDLSNCVELTIAEYSNVGEVLSVNYRSIGNSAGDTTRMWKSSNSFTNICLQAEAQAIMARQLADGAYNMSLPTGSDGSFQNGQPLWIEPYLGLQAAQAMLLAYDIEGDAAYLASAKSYIEWYVAHLEADGTVFAYTGTYPSYSSTNNYDSTDSYAAEFLTLANMYFARTLDTTFLNWAWSYVPTVVGAMELTLDTQDGLTYAKPGNDFKYLMDNTEVFLGFKNAALLAFAANDTAKYADWNSKAYNVQTGIETMYLLADGRYAWAKSSNGALSTDWVNVYADGDAQMFAIKNVLGGGADMVRAATVWQSSVDQFIPAGVPYADVDSAWVLATISAGKYGSTYDEVAYANYQKQRDIDTYGYLNLVFPNIFIIHQQVMSAPYMEIDLDQNAVINLGDFAELASDWIAGENMDILGSLAQNWLSGYDYNWWE